jgi:hypothetical protein
MPPRKRPSCFYPAGTVGTPPASPRPRALPESAGQSGEKGVNGEIGKLSHLVVGSVLNRMRDEDASHVREAEGSGLRGGSLGELG